MARFLGIHRKCSTYNRRRKFKNDVEHVHSLPYNGKTFMGESFAEPPPETAEEIIVVLFSCEIVAKPHPHGQRVYFPQ